MILLAYDATTPVAALALRLADGTLLESTLAVGATHSTQLLPAIDALLTQAGIGLDQVGGLVVANGPGSFTGLRIALATAKGLACAKNLPIFAVSTLRGLSYHGLTHQLEAPQDKCLTLPMLDARRQQVYGALYHGAEEVLPEDTYTIAQLLELLPQWLDQGYHIQLVGDGAVAHGKALKETLGEGIIYVEGSVPSNEARGLLWAYDQDLAIPCDYKTLSAVYLRVSQAERERAMGIDHAAPKGL